MAKKEKKNEIGGKKNKLKDSNLAMFRSMRIRLQISGVFSVLSL